MGDVSGNSAEMVRVAYFDDQTLFREALTAILEDTGSIIVIRSTTHKDRNVSTLSHCNIAAVLVSLDSQLQEAIATIREVRFTLPDVPVCGLVAEGNLIRARDALNAGCKGAVSSAATPHMLISALENLARGQAFVDPSLGGRLLVKTLGRGSELPRSRNGSRSSNNRGVSTN